MIGDASHRMTRLVPKATARRTGATTTRTATTTANPAAIRRHGRSGMAGRCIGHRSLERQSSVMPDLFTRVLMRW